MAATHADKLTRYDQLIESIPDLKRSGRATAYTSLNGNMFSFLSPDAILAFRLAKDERAAFLEEHPDAIVQQYGALMKDYVAIPDAMLNAPDVLETLWARCVANARTLKPKATTRKKK